MILNILVGFILTITATFFVSDVIKVGAYNAAAGIFVFWLGLMLMLGWVRP